MRCHDPKLSRVELSQKRAKFLEFFTVQMFNSFYSTMSDKHLNVNSVPIIHLKACFCQYLSQLHWRVPAMLLKVLALGVYKLCPSYNPRGRNHMAMWFIMVVYSNKRMSLRPADSHHCHHRCHSPTI